MTYELGLEEEGYYRYLRAELMRTRKKNTPISRRCKNNFLLAIKLDGPCMNVIGELDRILAIQLNFRFESHVLHFLRPAKCLKHSALQVV